MLGEGDRPENVAQDALPRGVCMPSSSACGRPPGALLLMRRRLILANALHATKPASDSTMQHAWPNMCQIGCSSAMISTTLCFMQELRR
jgi:hypothetical protein